MIFSFEYYFKNVIFLLKICYLKYYSAFINLKEQNKNIKEYKKIAGTEKLNKTKNRAEINSIILIIR